MTETDAAALVPIDDEIDHARGPATARHVILEYGDYECPYSRAAYRHIQRVERDLGARVRFAFRHFPLTEIHPHALAAAAAAEAAQPQGRFWPMHDLLFRRQAEREDDELRAYAGALNLDVARFDADRVSGHVLARIARDVTTARATGQVHGTPTLFLDGRVHSGDYHAAALVEAIAEAG